MPYVSITGTPKRDSNASRTSRDSDAEAERISRKEDCWVRFLRSPAVESNARWIVGTAVYHVGRNSLSQPKKEAASYPGAQITLEPAANAVSNPDIRPCAWNRGRTLSNRSRGASAKAAPAL